MLRFIEPAKPTLVDVPPTGPGWLHEIKQDGFRTQLIVEDRNARAFSSSGIDWSDRYPAIITDAYYLDCKAAIIDGEMIVADEHGRSDFHLLARAIKSRPQDLVLIAFDLLHLDGEDLRTRPLTERRALLEPLIASARSEQLVLSRAYEGEGADVFAAIENLGLEGIVSKRANGWYRSGTKAGWLKIKSFHVGTFSVIGVDKTPAGAPVALLADATGAYAGQAFVSLPNNVRDAFWRFVELQATPDTPIKGLRRKGATWVNGGMVAKVKHLRGEEMLRHASVVEITLPKARLSTRAGTTNRKTSTRPRALR